MSKLPAIQFYVGDWRKDNGIQSMDYFTRGLWFEMLMVMHESEPRGYLLINGKKPTDEQLVKLFGLDKQILTTQITILLDAGVASKDPATGVIFNRRMVRDEEVRKVRAECGKLGGNPRLLNQNATTRDKVSDPPSTSVAVSTSTTLQQKHTPVKRGDDLPGCAPKSKKARKYNLDYYPIKIWEETYKAVFNKPYIMQPRERQQISALAESIGKSSSCGDSLKVGIGKFLKSQDQKFIPRTVDGFCKNPSFWIAVKPTAEFASDGRVIKAGLDGKGDWVDATPGAENLTPMVDDPDWEYAKHPQNVEGIFDEDELAAIAKAKPKVAGGRDSAAQPEG